jgi:hypothetical protein
MSRLDAFFGRIQAAGVDLALGFGLNFAGGLTATRNASTKFTDVTLADGSIEAAQLAAPADDLAVPFVIGPVSFSLTFAGVPVDDAVLASAPFGFKILDVTILATASLNPAATAQLRTASGGGGSALSSSIAMPDVAGGTYRNNDTQPRTVAAGGSIYLRRSTDVTGGTVHILAVRT